MTRTLHLTNPPMRGLDVVKAQNLLDKHKWLNGAVDGICGPRLAKDFEHAKYMLGYPVSSILPTCGASLLEYLAGSRKLPTAYKLRANSRKNKVRAVSTRENALRMKVVYVANWGIKNNPYIHYQQLRPIDGIHKPFKLPLSTDCSGFATLCYKWAGAPDPNGRGFDGLGFTGTLLQHMKAVTKNEVKLGDLVVYGTYPGHHVCVVIELGDDPLLASHGQERDPHAIRHSVEQQYQPQPANWLTLPSWS